MKANAIVRIVIWSLVLVILLGVLGAGLLFRTMRSHSDSDEHFGNLSSGSFSLDPSDVREIHIEWAAGNIVIEPAAVDSIQISESAPGHSVDSMVWKLDKCKLSIRSSEKITVAFGINQIQNYSKDLTILVPMNWECASLEIDAASAAVSVKNLVIRNVDFDGASGTCNFDNCDIDTLDVDTASGDISFTGTMNILECDSASANVCAVFDNVPSRIDVDSMSGDLDITLPSHAGFMVSMDGLAEDFTSDFLYTQRNGEYWHGDGQCRITLDALSSDVYIRAADTPDDAY